MKQLLLLSGLFILLVAACKNNNSITTETSHHAEHAALVALNNGQRWNANLETTAGIQKMSSLFKELPEQPTREDYKSLKSRLDHEFDMILQNCTMTGEAHDQLHNYLMPLKEMMGDLDSNSAEEAKMASDNIQHHLMEYDNYFQ